MKKIYAVNCALKVGNEDFDPKKPEYRFRLVAGSEKDAKKKVVEAYNMCRVEIRSVEGPVEITDEQYETGDYPDPFSGVTA